MKRTSTTWSVSTTVYSTRYPRGKSSCQICRYTFLIVQWVAVLPFGVVRSICQRVVCSSSGKTNNDSQKIFFNAVTVGKDTIGHCVFLLSVCLVKVSKLCRVF